MCFCFCFKSSAYDDDSPLAAIVTIRYKKATKYSKANCGNETCTICLEDFCNNEKIRVAPCNHGYHKSCLENWLTVKSICPMCQSRLKIDHSEEHTPLITTYTIDV